MIGVEEGIKEGNFFNEPDPAVVGRLAISSPNRSGIDSSSFVCIGVGGALFLIGERLSLEGYTAVTLPGEDSFELLSELSGDGGRGRNAKLGEG